jgi:hypothetical protein
LYFSDEATKEIKNTNIEETAIFLKGKSIMEYNIIILRAITKSLLLVFVFVKSQLTTTNIIGKIIKIAPMNPISDNICRKSEWA